MSAETTSLPIMAYVKCALVGIITGVVTTVAWVILQVFVVLIVMSASGSGGSVGVGVAGMLTPGMPAIVGFALGFYLMFRRQRARTSTL